MSLQNMPEEKYNGIFKDAADKIDFPFNEAAWANMEQKLDRKKPAFYIWQRFKIPALIAAVFLGGILVVNFSQFNFTKRTSDQDLVAKSSGQTEKSSNANSESVKEETGESNQSSSESKNNNLEDKNLQTGENNIASVTNNAEQTLLGVSKSDTKNQLALSGNNFIAIDDSQNARKKLNGDEEKTLKNKEKDTFYLGEDIAIIKNSDKSKLNGIDNSKENNNREINVTTNEATIASIKASAKNDQESLVKELENNTSNNNNSISNSNSFQPIANEFVSYLSPIPLIYPFSNSEILSIKNTDIDNSQIKLPKISKNKFAVLAMVSPDFTYNSNFVSKYAGVNYGVAAEYYFIKNASVSLGVNRAMKKYHVANNPYEFEGWTSPYSYPAKDVYAKCLVIDVPVTFKYYLLPSPTGKLFVGAGVSSYFMRSESYDFVYKTQYGEAKHHFDAIKRKNHYLSVYNFSLGFEKTVYKNLSIQLEPFIKIPGTGIGSGSIKLQSSGMFFSLKQRL